MKVAAREQEVSKKTNLPAREKKFSKKLTNPGSVFSIYVRVLVPLIRTFSAALRFPSFFYCV